MVTSEGVVELLEDKKDDYNHTYPAGNEVLHRHYFGRVSESRRNYKFKLWDDKEALIP